MTSWDKVISQAEVAINMRERKKNYIEKTAWRSAMEDEEQEGWYFVKDTKNPKKVKLFKPRFNVYHKVLGYNTLKPL